MLYPTISELTKDEFNRYELALATAKCARVITDEYVKQREAAEKAATGNKEAIYHAAMMDPHTGAQLSLDEIVALCDELYDAHVAAGFPIL